MKKLYLIASTFIFISLASFSQEFYGGLLAGFNGSQVEGDFASGYNKMGVIGGAWVQRDLSPKLYWGMELKVNQKGSRIKPTRKNNYTKFLYRLNYIDLPVLIGYKLKPYLSVFGGASYGYLFTKPRVYDNYGLSPTQYDYITDWELGGFLGIKVDLDRLVDRRWANHFQLETRIQHSLLSIDTDHKFLINYYTISQFNQVISTVIYYRIGRK